MPQSCFVGEKIKYAKFCLRKFRGNMLTLCKAISETSTLIKLMKFYAIAINIAFYTVEPVERTRY
jgi:hypothetical protein